VPEQVIFAAKRGIEAPEMSLGRVIFRHCTGGFISVRNPDLGMMGATTDH